MTTWTDDPTILAIHNLAAAIGASLMIANLGGSTARSFLDMFDALNAQLPVGPVREAMIAATKMQRDVLAQMEKA